MEVKVPGGKVYLRDKLDFAAGQAIRVAMIAKREELLDDSGALPLDALPDLSAAVTEHSILRGVERWEGKAFGEQPVTRQNIRRLILEDGDRGVLVGMAAQNLYAAKVIGPLAVLGQTSSPPTPANGSISAPTESTSTSKDGTGGSTPSPKRQRPSKPSSTTTTRTADIVPISA